MNDLQQRVLRALALKAMEDRLGEVVLLPEDLGEIDYQLAVYPVVDPPSLRVRLISKEYFDELVKEGVPHV